MEREFYVTVTCCCIIGVGRHTMPGQDEDQDGITLVTKVLLVGWRFHESASTSPYT